ncbi:MAG: ATP-binding protein, partial [Alphaproteobacteria bacterium]|nr:ATP-binding protein [Alphaproteobacteria bacterium]
LSFEQSRFVSLISRSARGLKEVIDDILETSNLQAGRIVLNPSRFELVEFCESIIEIYTPIAREQRLELGYLIHPKVPAWIEADPAKLRQILMSLVGNAIKFTPRGHILLQIGCTAQRESEPLNLWVEVADTGIGIPDSLKPTIFDAFVQGDPSLRRAYGGTGLGLSIARQLVEMFGGKIGVSDRDGGGTIFRFSIPLKPIPLAEMPSPQPTPNLRGTSIWLYSQSLVTQLVLTTTLSSWGGRVEINPPIPNGLRLPRSEAPALVLIDRHSRPAAVDVNELIAMTRGSNSLLWLGEIDEPAGEVQLARPILLHPLMAVMNRLLHRPVEAPTAPDWHPGTLLQSPLPSLPLAPRGKDSEAAKILLVEDNKINQTVVTTMLTRLGHSVEAANNGQSALKLLDEKSFDLVLMDLQMPGMDGEEATRRIRAETRFENLPIIAFTAHALTGVREKVLAQGFDECLSKPVKREQFAAVVARWRSGRLAGAG